MWIKRNRIKKGNPDHHWIKCMSCFMLVVSSSFLITLLSHFKLIIHKSGWSKTLAQKSYLVLDHREEQVSGEMLMLFCHLLVIVVFFCCFFLTRIMSITFTVRESSWIIWALVFLSCVIILTMWLKCGKADIPAPYHPIRGNMRVPFSSNSPGHRTQFVLDNIPINITITFQLPGLLTSWNIWLDWLVFARPRR